MEYIKVICCIKENKGCNSIPDLLEKMKDKIKIEFMNPSSSCLADFTQEDIDEEDIQFYDPLEYHADFIFKDKSCKIDIKRVTKRGKKILDIVVDFLADEPEVPLENSEWYDFKESFLYMLHGEYTKIFWVADSQNVKIAANLYSKFNYLENYLREIINRYMIIKYGGAWFENYSYDDYKAKYENYSEWFKNSRYHLFKMVDNHLSNLEMSDIFELLKTAKKKQISKNTAKALSEIKKQEQENAKEFVNIDILDQPSLWEEEKLDEVFDKRFVKKWETDLSKRRNMIAHNKMLCKDFYFDTMAMLEQFQEKLGDIEQKLIESLRIEEEVMIKRLQLDDEIAMNLEYCEIETELPEDQDIVERINDKDDFIDLSGIISDRLSLIPERISDIVYNLKEIQGYLCEETFFEEDTLINSTLLEQYIDFANECSLYSTWKSLLENGISIDVYNLIEPALDDYLQSVVEKLLQVQGSIFCIDMQYFSEGKWVEIKDFNDDKYTIHLNGWFCPERGCSNELFVELLCNDEIIRHGGIYISYGDYEMSEDGIPLPCIEDELIVNLKDVNKMLDEILDDVYRDLSELEDKLEKIEL